MDFKVMNKAISTNETLFDDFDERPVDCDFVLPDYCPDIAAVLKCTLKPVIQSKQLSGDRMLVDGQANIRVMYLDEARKCVRCCEFSQPFTSTFAVKSMGLNPCVRATAKTDYVNCRATSPRRLDVHGAFTVKLKITAEGGREVVCDATGGGLYTRNQPVSYSVPAASAEKTFTISEVLDLGSGKPPAEALIRGEAVPCLTDCKLLANKAIIKGEATPFVMELPPYRLPTLFSVLMHCWERTWMYVKKAGTVILAISIIIWAGLTYPKLDEAESAKFDTQIEQLTTRMEALPAEDEGRAALEEQITKLEEEKGAAELAYSYAGRLGKAIEPLTLPAGFEWRTDIALLAGVAAKEAVVSTMGTAYSLGDVDPEDAQSLGQLLQNNPNWNKATALSLMLFVLLYSPCFVSLVVIQREAGGWRWLIFSMVFNTLLAFAVSVAAYQIGMVVWD